MKFLLLISFIFSALGSIGQAIITRDIKFFGARGDGKTNDHEAFLKAAEFFNARGGNGKLVISKGRYLVGKQVKNADKKNKLKPYLEGIDVLHFKEIKNMTIIGQDAPVIAYAPNLKFGTFVPATGKISANGNNFTDFTFAATIGNAIAFTNCTNMQVSNIELNGNNGAVFLGGIFGDFGRQLPHSGIYIWNSVNVIVNNVNIHHFALDGMYISNQPKSKKIKDAILVTNSKFEYNGRQGLSWVGGNDLMVVNSSFNHTGKGRVSSPPGAGIDIEATVSDITNGKFINCSFINNSGCGIVADSGPSSNCRFDNCIIWGVTAWSVWITKPAFTFNACKIYGSIVHGYDAKNDYEATKFIGCLFEDLPYNGVEPYGSFLIEQNNARRMLFENCTMRAHKKKVAWFGWTGEWKPDEKFQLVNCTMEYKGNNMPDNAWVGNFNNVRFNNNKIIASHVLATNKNYYWNNVDNKTNVFVGANSFGVGKKVVRY